MIEQTKEPKEALDAARALNCLYVAVDSSVADDVNAKVRAYIGSLIAERDELLALVALSKTLLKNQSKDNERLKELLNRLRIHRCPICGLMQCHSTCELDKAIGGKQ